MHPRTYPTMLRVPHLRPAPTGGAADAVRAAAHVAAASGAPRVEASSTHHPLSGMYVLPKPPNITSLYMDSEGNVRDAWYEHRSGATASATLADPYIINERKGVTAGAEPPAMAAKDEARAVATYHNMPFRGALRAAATMG